MLALWSCFFNTQPRAWLKQSFLCKNQSDYEVTVGYKLGERP